MDNINCYKKLSEFNYTAHNYPAIIITSNDRYYDNNYNTFIFEQMSNNIEGNGRPNFNSK